MKKISNKGFTLIELLVVIAIIGILSGIVMASLSGARAKSRDAKRISDIAQIQLALEQYFDRCHIYPSSLVLDTTDCSYANLGTYISKIPTDPSVNSYIYEVSDDHYNYVLQAQFESDNPALNDSLPPSETGFSPNPADIECNKNSPNFYYCMGPK